MKYLIELTDDEGNSLYKNETSLGEIAESYVKEARKAEDQYVENLPNYYEGEGTCQKCGAELLSEVLSTDADGNRTEYATVCPHGH